MSSADGVPLAPPAWRDRIAALDPEGGPSGAQWLRSLPDLLAEGRERWDLTWDVGTPPWTGHTALVVPVHRGDEALVLKALWPHREARDEHLGLRLWAGDGAVRLVAADPGLGLLLLERLDGHRTLEDPAVDADDACTIIGGLLARLHRPAPPSVQRLADLLAPTLDALPSVDLPRRIVTRTQSLARDLLQHPAAHATLLHADLHFANVLAATREPWLAIDPKPIAGHPGWELHALLRNRTEEMGTGAALRWSVRHRLDLVAERTGDDAEELRLWSLLHTGVQLAWAAQEGDDTKVTRQLALHKALEE